MDRVFLVGCPRSGTTLLQSMLASSSDIRSFPESHFFVNLFAYRRIFQKLGIASRRVRVRVKEFLVEMGEVDMMTFLPVHYMFVSQYVRGFVQILDTLALRQGELFWLEKTPDHLLYVHQIEKLIPGAKFIHLLRNGSDVVASLYEVTHLYPQSWGGPWDIDKCIEKWNKSVRISMNYLDAQNHKIVRYEDLVTNTKQVLINLSDFLGIGFDEMMLYKYKKSASMLMLEKEAWKFSVKMGIHVNNQKFHSIFNAKEKKYILNNLFDIKYI